MFRFRPKLSRLLFYFSSGIYTVNDRYLKRPQLHRWAWLHIRNSLFKVGGACRHSGNCCRAIMLYHKGQPVTTLTTLDSLQQNKNYGRFTPEVDPDTSPPKIKHFNCTFLSQDNLCQDYANRPTCCRQYPHSYYEEHESLLEGCGYHVEATNFQPNISYLPLQRQLHGFCKHNKLDPTPFYR